ncbi:MAG: hypothetical protein J5586_03595 [Clostridia bacterium]|nr:hypothetical protein [Clostridia bacterium]
MAKKDTGSNPLGTVRRSIWYVLRAVLVVSLLLGLAFAVFTECMYITNMGIIVTSGMKLRAETILKNGAVADLRQYFTEEHLNTDPDILGNPYSDFIVDSYDYRYSIKGISVLPWAKTGSVTYIERIPSIIANPVSDEVTGPVKPWTPMLYKIQLVKVDGCWLIDRLIVIEENPEEEAKPTPDYSQLEDKNK